MDKKENKGGLLSNQQVEQDNAIKGKEQAAYQGAQDTGDKVLRQEGNDVQQRDGLPAEEGQEL